MTDSIFSMLAGAGLGSRWSEGTALQLDDVMAVLWLVFFLITVYALFVSPLLKKKSASGEKAAQPTDQASVPGGCKAPPKLRTLSSNDQAWVLAARAREHRMPRSR